MQDSNDVQRLSELFPNKDPEWLAGILSTCKGDVDEAVDAILSDSEEVGEKPAESFSGQGMELCSTVSPSSDDQGAVSLLTNSSNFD